jgi:NAD(P)H-hydrate repair Nnr-like enzyme with NAD(P)H-hydrate dehydratase domain
VGTFLAGNPAERSTEAVAAAAYVHGLAGELVGEGAVAWDVAEAIPEAIELVRQSQVP